MDEVAVLHDGGALAGGFSFFCRFRAPLLSLGFFLVLSWKWANIALGMVLGQKRESVGANSRRSFFTRI